MLEGAKGSLRTLFALVLVVGCTARPSPAQCEQMVEHVIELTAARHEGRAAVIAEEAAQRHRESLHKACLDDGTLAEVECVLAAASLDEVRDCAPER